LRERNWVCLSSDFVVLPVLCGTSVDFMGGCLRLGHNEISGSDGVETGNKLARQELMKDQNRKSML